jgi:putative flippase GtrA
VVQLAEILPRRWRGLTRGIAKYSDLAVNTVIRILPRRFQHMSDEVIKFGIIGVINLVVNFAVVNVLWATVLRDGELKAKAIATIVATTCAYFMNRHWTYRDRPKSTLRREYTLFLFFNAVGLVMEVSVVGLAKYGLGSTHILVLNLGTGVGIVLGTIFRFWAYRTHVFKLDTVAEGLEKPAVVSTVAKVNGAQPVGAASGDAALQAELTQIELDAIVVREQTAARNRS